MSGVSVGLGFDLSGWTKGLREAANLVREGLSQKVMDPFNAAIKRTQRQLSGDLKGALQSAFSPLTGAIAGAVGFEAIRRELIASMGAADAYGDSVKKLKAALGTLGGDTGKASAGVQGLGVQLSAALGTMRADTNEAFGNFVTRGFDLSQARQLTILAANYAKKTGKPLADVSKMLADAANGGVDAIKELGLQVSVTGNKVTDAKAAVAALKGAYGSVGADLVKPSEQLAATFNELQVGLGQRLLPLFAPLVQYANDFVNGLLHTEDGRKVLDQVAATVQDIIDFSKGLVTGVLNFVAMVKSGGSVIVGLIKGYIHQSLADMFGAIEALPGSKLLMEKLGFGPGMGKALQDQVKEDLQGVMKSSSDFMRAQDAWLTGGDVTGLKGIADNLARQGKTIREKATADLNREQAATAGQTFAGKVATEEERGKAQQKLKSQIEASGAASPDVGQRISVRIVSTRPDRFRKART